MFKSIYNYILIKRSGLFDCSYYLLKYSDVRKADIDPLWHFIRFGWKEGRNPSEIFNTEFYLTHNEDVFLQNINPLLHYIQFGSSEGRQPNSCSVKLNDSNSIKDNKYPNSEKTFMPPIKTNQINRSNNSYSTHKRNRCVENEDRFLLPDMKTIEKLKPELINWDGEEVTLVKRNERLWVIKGQIIRSNLKRELLVSSLARGLVNAAEVKTLNEKDICELRNLGLVNEDSSPSNTLLIRLAQDYNINDLPLQDFDLAMAGEIIFSLWVRRRDFGNWNRAISKNNIPVFYDYHASLNFESWLFDIDSFFEHLEPGHPGRWRILEQRDFSWNTISLRKLVDGVNYVNNIKNFDDALNPMAMKIYSTTYDFRIQLKQAGYSNDEFYLLSNFLEGSKRELINNVKKLRRIIYSPLIEQKI